MSARKRFRVANPPNKDVVTITRSQEYQHRTLPGERRVVFEITPGKAFEICYDVHGNGPFRFFTYIPEEEGDNLLKVLGIGGRYAYKPLTRELYLNKTQIRDIYRRADGLDEIIRRQISERKDDEQMQLLLDEEGRETDVELGSVFYANKNSERKAGAEIHIRRAKRKFLSDFEKLTI